MPPTGLAAVIKRRWYLALIGILVTLGLCAVAFVAFPAQYQAKAVVLLLPPASASVSGTESAAGQNPYVSLGLVDGLNDVLAQAMTDSATGSDLLSAGLNGSYTVANDPATSGPLILITGTAKTSSTAVAIANHIVALVPQTLLRLQQAAGVVDTKNNVTSTVLNPPSKTVKVRKNQERAIIAAGVVGIVLTLLITAAADKVLLGRRRRASAAGEASAEADPVASELAPIEHDEPATAAVPADIALETSEREDLVHPVETLTSSAVVEPTAAEPAAEPVVYETTPAEDEDEETVDAAVPAEPDELESDPGDDTIEPVAGQAEDEPAQTEDEPAQTEDEPVAAEVAPTEVEDSEPATNDSVEDEPQDVEDAEDAGGFVGDDAGNLAEATEPSEIAEPSESTEPPADGIEARVNGASTNGASTGEATSTSAPEAELADVEVADVEVADVEVADVEVADVEVADVEVADAELVTASQRRPEPAWRLRPGRTPGRERTISRNGRPLPRFDSNQATLSPDEISRPV
jgi:capsular polysaccharide biosynthesis protein